MWMGGGAGADVEALRVWESGADGGGGGWMGGWQGDRGWVEEGAASDDQRSKQGG